MNSDGHFASDIPLEIMEWLLEWGKKYSFDPTSCVESETYFLNLWGNSKNMDFKEQRNYLKNAVTNDFKAADDFPDWLQNPDWQFYGGLPMLFVGQIEANIEGSTAVFYTFYDDKTGKIKTIVQFE